MGGSIPSPPHGDPDRILVHPTTPGRLGSPKHYWGAVTGGGSPVAARLAAFGCCQQKHNTKPPQKKGKKKKKKQNKKKKREAKQTGGWTPPQPPARPPLAERLLHIPVCWRRGCIGITNWKTFLRGKSVTK